MTRAATGHFQHMERRRNDGEAGHTSEECPADFGKKTHKNFLVDLNSRSREEISNGRLIQGSQIYSEQI